MVSSLLNPSFKYGLTMACPSFNHRFHFIDGQTMEEAWTNHGQSTEESPTKLLPIPCLVI
ncbi:hypothetical protein OAT16_04290 [Prolixibacteraceae bacterium]|nr:hypothetical protein [Prolixibacteraceae bacterium]